MVARAPAIRPFSSGNSVAGESSDWRTYHRRQPGKARNHSALKHAKAAYLDQIDEKPKHKNEEHVPFAGVLQAAIETLMVNWTSRMNQ
jgi:hypothetical protein